VTAPGPVPEINLALYWATETDLVDASIAAVQVRLPEWVPAEGNTEVVLLEGIALQVAQEVFTINQLPRVVFEAVLSINGILRQQGQYGQAQVLVSTVANASGSLVLPKGSVFRAKMPDGTTVDFKTLAAETIAVGAVDSPVWAQCSLIGTRPRVLAPGTKVTGVATPTWIKSAKLGTSATTPSSAVTGGVDPEDDADFWTRGAAVLRTRPSSLVIAQNFADAALADENVGRSAAWERWDGVGDKTQLGTDLGHATVAVTDDLGAALSSGQMTTLHDSLAAKAQAGLTLHVIAPVFSAVTVTLTVVADVGVATASLKTALEADLRSWLSPVSWPWGKALTANDLIVRAGRFPGVAAVTATGGTGWTTPSTQPQGLFAANPTITATVVAS